MRIGMTGSSGLIGTAAAELLTRAGHEVVRLHRGRVDGPGPRWDPAGGWIEDGAFDGCDAVVHLAGASIGEGRWTPARKRELRASRIEATRLLVDHLGSLERPPRVLVSASAIGYYGDRGDEMLEEDARPGTGFLAELVRDWEAEVARASDAGMRVAMLRFGIVLATEGGALPRMLLPFRLGIGGRLGSGRQWFSWVALPDAARAIEWAVTHDVRGALNVTAPGPLTNVDFTRTLGQVLHRPAVLPAPRLGLRLLLGEAADELLLSSTRAVPARLLASGFEFEYSEADEALEAVLHGGESTQRRAA